MKRQWLLLLLAAAFLLAVVLRFTELETLAETLASGLWQWVLAAAVLQLVYQAVYARLYQSAFRTVEVQARWRHLLPVTFASRVVNVAAPVVGAGGATLFVDDAIQRGQPGARAAAGAILVNVADMTAFGFALAGGLLYLFQHQKLRPFEVVAAAIVVLIAGVQVSFLLLGYWGQGRLRRMLGWVQGIANRVGGRFGRSGLLPEGWAGRHAAEFGAAARAIAAHPGRLGGTLGVALVLHAVNLLSLYALTRAFHAPLAPAALVAAYAMDLTFRIASVTPQGTGVAEGVMVVVYTSLGVPSGTAAALALSFGGLYVWLPVIIGFVLLRSLPSFRSKKSPNP